MPELPAIPTLTPYRMDVQQGNVVTQEMVEKLKPGMTPSQVRFILGTPLVVDAFHKDRWDYVYRFSKGGRLQESRRIVIVFQDDKLARIEGDVVPANPRSGEGGGTAAPGSGRPPGATAAPEKGTPSAAGAQATTGGPTQGALPGAPGESPTPQAAQPSTGSSDAKAAAAAAGADTGGDADNTKLEKANVQKPKEEKPKEERGFFGRMLDKLGF